MGKYTISIITASILAAMCLGGCMNLSKAAYRGKFNQVKKLVDDGHDVNAYDKWGWTPLMWATYYNFHKIARHLLDNGANPDLQTEKKYKTFPKGTTALMIAACYSNTPIIRELRKNRADASLKDASGQTAVAYAEKYYGKDMAKLVRGDYD